MSTERRPPVVGVTIAIDGDTVYSASQESLKDCAVGANAFLTSVIEGRTSTTGGGGGGGGAGAEEALSSEEARQRCDW